MRHGIGPPQVGQRLADPSKTARWGGLSYLRFPALIYESQANFSQMNGLRVLRQLSAEQPELGSTARPLPGRLAIPVMNQGGRGFDKTDRLYEYGPRDCDEAFNLYFMRRLCAGPSGCAGGCLAAIA